MIAQTDLLRDGGATFSPCGLYRYQLWRRWKVAGTSVAFVMLNPSTADETENDPTVERCERFARRWGYAGLYVANLFALRATDPSELREADDPVGPENDEWLFRTAAVVDRVVLAWGNHGEYQRRGRVIAPRLVPVVRERGGDLLCLALNGTGHPRHPLYMKSDTHPIPFPGYARET